MKVYIATDGDYSAYRIKAVFTDKEQAELYSAVHMCEIEEYEADEYKIEGKKDDLKEMWIYEKGLNIFGSLYENLYFDRMTLDDIEEINVQKFPRPLVGIIKTFDRDTDEEKIKKIMRDKYAQISYEAQVEQCGESLGL